MKILNSEGTATGFMAILISTGAISGMIVIVSP